MAIDFLREKVINLHEAPEYLGHGRQGQRPHVSFLVRAIKTGIRGQKLEAVRLGGRWLTSVEALQRWCEAQTPSSPESTQKPATKRHRRAASSQDHVDRLLDEAGL
jgi:hypothetical protein